ncbi:MAG: VIT and VWA domain-containing protein [Bryobacteraceae bacterium]
MQEPNQKNQWRRIAAALAVTAGATLVWAAARPVPAPGSSVPVRHADSPVEAAGELTMIDREGKPGAVCPLKHTDVKANITGFLARVTVTQEFENPLTEKIEAVYTFPLPSKAAVDDMTMHVAGRTVRGLIKERDEARKIFEAARNRGQVASLLDQERPNIFTQAVTNIPPGEKVRIVISYVETLPYEAGTYEFVFPTVVGPRYSPKGRVPDAGKIAPPITPEGARAGHDISIEVALDAGLPIQSLESKLLPVTIDRPAPQRAVVKLKNQAEIPNRDFILRYDVAGRKIDDAVLSHRDSRGGFFTLVLQPPDAVTAADTTPKELVFVVDTSGSMSGFPIEKSKEVIKLALDGLYPRDTFNLITFAGDTHVLFPQPVPATPENVRKAQQFLLTRRGGGGTEMMKAIRAALDPSDQQEHIRIVCFMTDGYVGNDMEILSEVKRHPNARIFSFGVGNSVNRFLLDKMAEEARGEVEYVTLSDDGSAAAKRFHDRVRNPLLTDIAIDWNGLAVTEVYPKRIPDLFGAKPVVVTGRYEGAPRGEIRLRGHRQGREFERRIAVNLSGKSDHDVLATLWARNKVEDLMSQDWQGVQHRSPSADVKAAIVRLGVDFRLMTQFTSFVAVEESIVTENGQPRRIEVPVEMPQGVSYEGIFGNEGKREMAKMRQARGSAMAPSSAAIYAPSPIRAAVRAPMPGRATSAADMARAEPERDDSTVSKLDPAVAAWTASAQTRKVKLWLTDSSAATLRKLKALGVTVTKVLPGNIVLGEITGTQIRAVAALSEITFVSPDLGQPR